MDILNIRNMYSLSRMELSRKLNIPVKTIINWEQGIRKAPEYVLDVIKLFLENGLTYNEKDVTPERVVEIRESTGLSRRQFSELTKIPIGTLCKWEQGTRKPPTYFINMLALVLEAECFEKMNTTEK